VVVDRVRGWNIPTADWGRTIHGSGFVLVGDAAGLVDPFSGEGIGNAMTSGKVAAEAAVRACGAGDFSSASLAEYPEKLWKALDKRELKLHYRLRRLGRSRTMLNFLAGRAAARPDVLEWMTSMTGEKNALRRKKELVSPTTYVKLLFRRK
jgi:flavin-dependent dehydrogenase